MKRFLQILILNFSLCVLSHSQNSLDMNHPQMQTDTIGALQLSKMEPDSNIVSFQIQIVAEGDSIGNIWNVSGNKIPESAKQFIENLKPESRVAYEEISGIQNGVLVKLPARIYRIK